MGEDGCCARAVVINAVEDAMRTNRVFPRERFRNTTTSNGASPALEEDQSVARLLTKFIISQQEKCADGHWELAFSSWSATDRPPA